MPANKIPEKKYVKTGETVTIELPYSEVCMHMRVAGRIMFVSLVGSFSAQILNIDGSKFSSPILRSEAGFYVDSEGTYYYPPNRENFVLTI